MSGRNTACSAASSASASAACGSSRSWTALKDPLINYPLLELQHACLALGFQGVHRSAPNGQAALQQIQRNLYEMLRRVRPKVDHDLSPRWQGQKLAQPVVTASACRSGWSPRSAGAAVWPLHHAAHPARAAAPTLVASRR